MDIVKINGASYVQGDSAKKELLTFLDKRIILKDDIPVFQFIDSAGFDGNSIHKLRIAKEIEYGFRTYLKHKPSGKVLLKPESFSELIRYLDEGMLPSYRFVLDTGDKEILSRTIQQLIYLNIDIEVMLRSEESEIRKTELFAKLSGELTRTLKEVSQRIHSWNAGSAAMEYRSTILHILSDLETDMKEMQERDLKVAVMALKKSGKSVVVNCLLEGDYAPASIELPTFTTCIYRKKGDKRISLQYKNHTTYFDSPDGLKKHILNEFKNIHADMRAEYVPDVMDIGYIPARNDTCNYTIIDTPGPDLAGSYHSDIAYKWIREADVILFIIDYSKHLSSNEEEFFRSIKSVFEEHQKFYSFIVIVNKLDLMYLSEEKKSGLRFIDFLRSKLSDLGYRGFIVFGISALQYYYSLIAPRIKGCGSLQTDDGVQLGEAMDACLRRYQGKDEMTILSFLDSQIRNLHWFHGKQNATLQDLRDKSGIEQLMRYINYIAIEKAHIEFFNHKMSVVDRKIEEFQNSFIGDLLSRLEKNSRVLEEMVSEITGFSEQVLATVRQDFHMENILDRIGKDLDLARKSLHKILAIQMENIERQLIKELKALSNDELVAFQQGGRLEAVEGVAHQIGKDIIAKLYLPVLGKYFGSFNRELAEKDRRFGECKRIIQEKIVELDGHLQKDYHLNCPDIVLPKLSDSFTRFDFPSIKITPGGLFAQSLVKERLVRKQGAIGTIVSFLTLGLVNIKTGNFKFDDRKLKKAFLIERKSLDTGIQKQVNEMHKALFAHLDLHFSRLEQDFSETYGRFEDDCAAVFAKFTGDLSALREEIGSKVEFLKETDKGLEQFSSLWNKISITE